MRQSLRHQVWIVLAAATVFFTNLGRAALWDEDEPLYASSARDMLQRGDWVVPVYNGQIFTEKPPLVYWTIIAGFKLFGVNELGARFWSAVFALATALVTYHLGRRLLRPEIGLWAGLIVASSLLYAVSARAATVDSALVLVTTAAILIFVSGGIARMRAPENVDGDQKDPAQAQPGFVPDSWGRFALFYACLGVAVLAKGPIGLLLPMAAVGLLLMIMNRRAATDDFEEAGSRWRFAKWRSGLARLWSPRNFLRSLWQMRPLTGLAVVAAVALPWYILVSLRTDGLWLREFLANSNWRAFNQPLQGHSGPPWYYLPATMIGLFPWSVFLLPTVVELVQRLRRPDPQRDGYVFLACWVGVWFGFWSICGTKLPHYVLPAYPALALLIGSLLDGWIAEPAHRRRKRLRTGFAAVILAGVCVTAAIPIVASIYMPGEELLGLIGLILVLGGGWCIYASRRGRRRQAVVGLAITSVAFVTALFGFASLQVDRHQFAKPLLADVRRHSGGRAQLAGFRFIRESLVFYAGGHVAYHDTVEDLRRFLDQSPRPYIFTTDEHQPAIEKHFPGELTAVARRPRFLRSGEVVVLTRGTASKAVRLAGRMPGEQKR